MGDEDRPRLRDVDHDAPDGLATNDVFDRGSVDGRKAASAADARGGTHDVPGPHVGADTPAEADE